MQPDSVVPSRVAGSNCFGSVGRTKVQDDEFKVSESLVQNAFDRLGEELVDVTYHHDDGHQGLIRSPCHLNRLQHIDFDLPFDIISFTISPELAAECN